MLALAVGAGNRRVGVLDGAQSIKARTAVLAKILVKGHKAIGLRLKNKLKVV
jgi:hypothetical protein